METFEKVEYVVVIEYEGEKYKHEITSCAPNDYLETVKFAEEIYDTSLDKDDITVHVERKETIIRRSVMATID